uniref:NADH-ubiquinone oxidoreductase chain 2 n=1 Tax=Candida saraburiensis TaxID=694444 RepID=S5TMJ6_9ASCO|nr:NADH dehydrogenase subunit 2 [Candida saraburiensis]AGS44045.1 NADH dehydrogenase subunit 2 [Candida saraburiensis]
MLVLTLFTYIIYLAYNPNLSQHLFRLTAISLAFIFYLSWDSLNLHYTNISIFNDWFSYTPGNSPIVLLLIFLVLSLIIYGTIIPRYNINNPWLALLIIVNLIGLILLPMVNDLIPLYVVIELQSYSLYLLTGVYNKSYNATRGAILYFVTGGIASVLILLSSAEVYQQTGLTNLSELATYYSFNNNNNFNSFDILIIGLLFKMGLAPLHAWSIAVYSYSPTYITAYISIVAKVSILSFIYINISLFNTQILLIAFYLSITIASYTPLYQVTLKSILAYSGILNFGYLLTAVILGDQAYYLYIIQYSLTHILIFYCILAIGEYTSQPSSQWSPIVNVNHLIIPNKTLTLIFIICLFSLIGIPPLPGFYGKYYIIVALMDSGLYLEGLAIIIFSVIATYYYAYIIKQLASNLNNAYVKPVLNTTISFIISVYIVLLTSFFVALPTLLEGITLLLN